MRPARQEHPGHRLRLRPRDPHGLRRVRLRRGDGADDLHRGQPRRAAAPPALPGQQGPVGQAHACSTTSRPTPTSRRSSCKGADVVRRRSAPRRARAPRSSPWPARSTTPAWSRCPIGTPLGEIIYDIGGGIPGGKEFKAAQIGGPSGGCIPKQHLNVPVDYESLTELGRDHGLRRPDRHGRGHLHGGHGPLLPGLRPGRVLRQVLALPRRHQAHAGDPRPHLRGQGRGGRHRAADRAGRHDQGHRALRPGPDRAQPGALDHPPLPRRVRGAHPRQALPRPASARRWCARPARTPARPAWTCPASSR